MKKINYFIVLLFVACLFGSCAVGTYVPHAVNLIGTQTTVVLDKANFRVVRNVEAVVEVDNDHLRRADVEKSAFAELTRKYPLTGSQTYINVVFEEVQREKVFAFHSGRYALKQYIAVRATIIEFLQDNGEPIQSVAPQGTAPRASIPTSDKDLKDTETVTPYQGSTPPSSQPNTQQTSDINKETFVPVEIQARWNAETRKIVHQYNKSQRIDAVYDFNEDGKLSVEELDYINYVLNDSKRASNKDVLFEMAHKDYESAIARMKKK